MASNIITSADAIFTLTISDLFNAPITLENWGSDRAWEQEAVEMAEAQMSIDGKLNRGWIPRAVNQTMNFSAASGSIPYMEAIITEQQLTRTILTLGGELTLKSTGRKYTFTNGCMMTGSVAPNGGTVLEARTFTFQWEKVFPAGI
ncbi:phage tail fiber protein [Gluconobacter kanchanaburiensis]|uniref:Tail protein n=1 Tax=Gluconobacter kanchanaburiensis NBRC 103587 TaxID=1307948 RepID=A0A511B615_9PROT|nr:hypothetical protein [Gluconobacter kanchanaburiensis]MBF0861278.1 hypothetical protein [Gluconobacter kanchanaburiensis]GBR71004.1 hypothetical protein AA103587_2168 [Gluconobacter kanchanaburiensis NBRC 103587]GEK95895.1 hypothetical protein GKA01_10920 [Gluconobacter kanchanaburiensis NBRC 103587]